jgi:hypothetical protein
MNTTVLVSASTTVACRPSGGAAGSDNCSVMRTPLLVGFAGAGVSQSTG